MASDTLVAASPAKSHWLTCSTPLDGETARTRLDLGDWSLPIKANAFGGTCTQYRMHETGAKLYEDGTEPFSILDVPGDVCDTWGDDWLQWSTRIHGKVTRIDLARDIGPTELARKRMMQMRRAWFGKRVETKIRTFEENRSYSPGSGFTWYFGGTTSPLRLRVYDRRGPLRLEFQWRPNDRDAILADIIAADINAAWRMLANKIRFEFSWFKKLLNGPVTAFHVEKPETDWLRTANELKAQYGRTLWALRLLGIEAKDLELPADDDTDRNALAKFLKWSSQAGEQGKALKNAITPLTAARATRHGKRGKGVVCDTQ